MPDVPAALLGAARGAGPVPLAALPAVVGARVSTLKAALGTSPCTPAARPTAVSTCVAPLEAALGARPVATAVIRTAPSTSDAAAGVATPRAGPVTLAEEGVTHHAGQVALVATL